MQRWQQQGDTEQEGVAAASQHSSHPSCVASLVLESKEQELAAMAVLACMYGVQDGPVRQLLDVQLLQMVLIADMLQVDDAVQAAKQRLTSCLKTSMSAELQETVARLQAWPTCLLPEFSDLTQNLPIPITAQSWVKAADLRDSCSIETVQAAPHRTYMEQVLLGELRDLHQVWSRADLQELLLGLPLPAVQLLLASHELMVRSLSFCYRQHKACVSLSRLGTSDSACVPPFQTAFAASACMWPAQSACHGLMFSSCPATTAAAACAGANRRRGAVHSECIRESTGNQRAAAGSPAAAGATGSLPAAVQHMADSAPRRRLPAAVSAFCGGVAATPAETGSAQAVAAQQGTQQGDAAGAAAWGTCHLVHGPSTVPAPCQQRGVVMEHSCRQDQGRLQGCLCWGPCQWCQQCHSNTPSVGCQL